MSQKIAPRVIAHRGWSSAFPENSLPAYAAACATGADELELDVRFTSDGHPVVSHDADTARTSVQTLEIASSTAAELGELDIKLPGGSVAPGLGIARLRQVLDLFYGHIGMNIHLKTTDGLGETLRMISSYLDSDGNARGVYVAGSPSILSAAITIAPHIPRCMLDSTNNAEEAVAAAEELECHRVQFRRNTVTPEWVTRATDLGIVPNLYFADEVETARWAVGIGIIGVLTNDAGVVGPEVRKMRRAS